MELSACSVCGGCNVRPSDGDHKQSNLYCFDCGQYVIGEEADTDHDVVLDLVLGEALTTEQLRDIIAGLRAELRRVRHHEGIAL